MCTKIYDIKAYYLSVFERVLIIFSAFFERGNVVQLVDITFSCNQKI